MEGAAFAVRREGGRRKKTAFCQRAFALQGWWCFLRLRTEPPRGRYRVRVRVRVSRAMA